MRSPQPSHPADANFSFATTFAFSINFAMGAGFLSLPWAFYKSGVILGVLMLIAIATPLGISVPYNLEAMARADAVFRLRRKNDSFRGEQDPLVEKSDHAAVSQFSTSGMNLMSDGNLVVRRDKFELYELCELFVGSWAKFLFLACLTFYTYGCLWAFGSVFSLAMASTMPLSNSDTVSYCLYLIVFTAIVVPLTCMELNEQVGTQIFLAFCRLVVAVLIVATSVYAYRAHEAVTLEGASPAPLVNWSGVTVVLPIAAYAFAFTQAMPALCEPVKDKTQLSVIFQCTIGVCLIGYAVIGAGVAVAFGSAVDPSCNLNWMTFTGNEEGRDGNQALAWMATGVRIYVVMFPALDVTSAFPLMAITLGNNMFSCVYGHNAKKMSRSYIIAFRLLAALPPLLGAGFVSNLGVITDYAGIAGCILAFIFPPLLAHHSEKYFTSRAWNPHTVYSNPLTTAVFRNMIFWFSALLVVVITIANVALPTPAE